MRNGLHINELGTKFYYLNDQFHRENGPAIEFLNGTRYWYFNGKFHRTDGPAVDRADGTKIWYYYGKRTNCQSQQEFELWIRFKAFL
jgi:hypothetical protein